MIGDRMQKALNEQVNKELYSAYLYLAMSAHSQENGLGGIGRWFRAQYEEEVSHAMKIYEYIHEQGGSVDLQAVAKPETGFKGPGDLFERALEHERFVTASINELVALAGQEKDYATQIFLQWFVSEQVEEEANVQEIVEKMKLVGDSGPALLFLDEKLGERKSEAE